MAPDESTPVTVDLTILEAIGIIHDLHHMIRLNRASSREEEADWKGARRVVMHKLIRTVENTGWDVAKLPGGPIGLD
jgi:hypothetical protein